MQALNAWLRNLSHLSADDIELESELLKVPEIGEEESEAAKAAGQERSMTRNPATI